jgi:tartrate dehydrogenase/decarboxylase/D-malate dehydrogenase
MAAVWAASMMLDSMGETDAGALVMHGVEAVALNGPRTIDLGGSTGTAEVGDAIVAAIKAA